MKKLTVENMVIDYLDAWAFDVRNWKFHNTNTNRQAEVYSSFFDMETMGYIPKETFKKFTESTCHYTIDDSCMTITSTTGRVLYRFNEEIGHFEKAC